jgi:hypothetical protein
VGLGELAKREGYVERQVKRWSLQWEHSKTRELPAIDEVATRCASASPCSRAWPSPTGDFRFGKLPRRRRRRSGQRRARLGALHTWRPRWPTSGTSASTGTTVTHRPPAPTIRPRPVGSVAIRISSSATHAERAATSAGSATTSPSVVGDLRSSARGVYSRYVKRGDGRQRSTRLRGVQGRH